MSDIQGNGYGDKYDWERIYTNTNAGNNSMAKLSIWTCRKCKAQFNHQYDLVPSIYEAMKQEKVPEECSIKEQS